MEVQRLLFPVVHDNDALQRACRRRDRSGEEDETMVNVPAAPSVHASTTKGQNFSRPARYSPTPNSNLVLPIPICPTAVLHQL